MSNTKENTVTISIEKYNELYDFYTKLQTKPYYITESFGNKIYTFFDKDELLKKIEIDSEDYFNAHDVCIKEVENFYKEKYKKMSLLAFFIDKYFK